MQKIKQIPTPRLEQIRSKLQSERNLQGSLSTQRSLSLLAVTKELDTRHAN